MNFLRRNLGQDDCNSFSDEQPDCDDDNGMPSELQPVVYVVVFLSIVWQVYKWKQWQRNVQPGGTICDYFQRNNSSQNQQSSALQSNPSGAGIELAPAAAGSQPIVQAQVMSVQPPVVQAQVVGQ